MIEEGIRVGSAAAGTGLSWQVRLHLGKEIQLFLIAFAIRATGRKVFWTQSGRLGLGPASTRAGDELWILKVGRVPFILRPLWPGGGGSQQGSLYALVSECYIHDNDAMWGSVEERLNGTIRQIELR